MKSQSITTLRATYKHDLRCFDKGQPEKMLMARDIEGAGLCWPLDWLKDAPSELREKWYKFMDGQTFCDFGFYERDVRRFLFEVYRKID